LERSVPELAAFKSRLDNAIEESGLSTNAVTIAVDHLESVLNQAREEAVQLKHHWIGTEHFALALAISPDPLLQQLFGADGMMHATLLALLKELLTQPAN